MFMTLRSTTRRDRFRKILLRQDSDADFSRNSAHRQSEDDWISSDRQRSIGTRRQVLGESDPSSTVWEPLRREICEIPRKFGGWLRSEPEM